MDCTLLTLERRFIITVVKKKEVLTTNSHLPSLLGGYSLSLFFLSGVKRRTRNVVVTALPGFSLHLQSLSCLLKKIWAEGLCLKAPSMQRKDDEVRKSSAVM